MHPLVIVAIGIIGIIVLKAIVKTSLKVIVFAALAYFVIIPLVMNIL